MHADRVPSYLVEAAALHGAVLSILHVERVAAGIRPIAVHVVGVQRVNEVEDGQGLGEGQARKAKVANRLARGGAELNQAVRHGHRDLGPFQAARRGPEVQRLRLGVETPFARLIQLLQEVLDVEAVALGQLFPALGEPPRDGDHPGGGVDLADRNPVTVPGGPGDDEDLSLVGLGPAPGKDPFFPAEGDRGGRVGRHRRLDEGPTAEVRILGIEIRMPGADLPLTVEEHLAEPPILVLSLRQLGREDLAAVGLPAGDDFAAAEDRLLARIGRVGDRTLRRATIPSGKNHGPLQAVGAAAQEHGDRFSELIPLELANGISGAGHRAERLVHRAGIRVVAVGGHVEIGLRVRGRLTAGLPTAAGFHRRIEAEQADGRRQRDHRLSDTSAGHFVSFVSVSPTAACHRSRPGWNGRTDSCTVDFRQVCPAAHSSRERLPFALG